MHGIGNDFVLIDTIRDGHFVGDTNSASQAICNRHTGIGADGLILVEKSDDLLEMRMFNPDGSMSEMCGNGLRVFGRLCHDRGYGHDEFPVKTGAGTLQVKCLPDATISINMGPAILQPIRIGMVGVSGDTFIDQEIGGGFRGTAISMGNPHLVIFVDDVAAVDLDREGPRFESSKLFQNRTNVHFVQVHSSSEVTQRTWERGAGITLACGTGACACAVASFLNNKTGRNVKVNLPGGTLQIDYQADGTVQMTGGADYSYEGVSSSLL